MSASAAAPAQLHHLHASCSRDSSSDGSRKPSNNPNPRLAPAIFAAAHDTRASASTISYQERVLLVLAQLETPTNRILSSRAPPRIPRLLAGCMEGSTKYTTASLAARFGV